MQWALIALDVFLLVVLGVCILFLAELWRITYSRGIPSIASTWAIVDRVIVERALPSEGLILDLGCGTGWTMRRLWRSGMHGPFIGYENAFVPWLFGRAWNFLTMCPVTIRRGDLFRAPFEDARGVYLFLVPAYLERFGPDLVRHLRPGTAVVSAEFPIPGLSPQKILEARGITNRHAKIYIYRIPAP